MMPNDTNTLPGITSTSSTQNEDVHYFILTKNERRGPYVLQQIESMWSSGTITADAMLQSGDSPPEPINVILKRRILSENDIQLQSRGIYIILAVLFGALGLHNFYAGRNFVGLIQLLTFGLGFLLLFVELIGLLLLIPLELLVLLEVVIAIAGGFRTRLK